MTEPVPTPAPAPVPTPPPTPAAPAPEPPKPADPAATNPWDDPKAAQAEIEKLRRENGAARTTAKAQAAEDARKELTQTLGKALGLVEDETDPVKLAEKLTTSQTEAQRARVELAVFRAAAGVNGDPTALLDSTSFLRSLDGVDPSDNAAVQAAIKAAVEANPRLGAATDPRTPAPNPAQGSSASGPVTPAQISRAELAGMTPEAIEQARLDGRLNEALGIKT